MAPVLAALTDDTEKTYRLERNFNSDLSNKKDWANVNTTYHIKPSSI